MALGWRDADGLADLSGAYALLIEVSRPFAPPIRRLAKPSLPAGRYLYVGSANGPGGIRARVRRHLRRGKKRHWHVDHLTKAFGVSAAVTVAGGDECAILALARRWPGVGVPVLGFGSSDCRRCPAHLVSLPDALEIAPALASLGPGAGGVILA
ncbi:MAG: DUF123 domain-containing protein [Rhodospirillales bacterium]|jgi:histidyl-tRNA synthetase|nr:DUF123 domain-containing protein [Rhodospirillales bacterium]MDP6883794.1 DUF123 domain-containing protein [Rhodospirillales bacterium]